MDVTFVFRLSAIAQAVNGSPGAPFSVSGMSTKSNDSTSLPSSATTSITRCCLCEAHLSTAVTLV